MSASAPTGLGLSYDDLGSGEPALLLLTSWCSSRARWAPAAPLLAENRRVVNLEWPSHGDHRPAGGARDKLCEIWRAGVDDEQHRRRYQRHEPA